MRCNACRRSHRRRYGSDCSARYTLKRHPLAYKRESSTKCTTCGSLDVTSIDAITKRARAKQHICRCCAYPFPHRRGSMRMCVDHALMLAGTEPTEDETRDYQRCLETLRSGWG